MKRLMKSFSRNVVDDLANALVENLKYCDQSVDYPNIDSVKADDGVVAEWFYPIYNGTNSFSELNAILTYTAQEAKFEEIGELMLGIGLVEMKHYGKLGELILKLGGKIEQKFNNINAEPGENVAKAIKIAIEAERKTIDFYTTLTKKIENVEQTETTTTVLQLIAKLIADEKVHMKLLNEYWNFLGYKEDEEE